ncbi:hypothetical protein R3P93_20080 [Rhodococcus cerastii]|uniref:Transposase n=1 Tax=Rhodococcus cerastii TaxID=908616 RepID=A0ABU4D561_9NOCA|nr:hypothetical protein [Rhodococcus cerastii]MDV6304867.1 hypothetical protein [Rhodococcus cerastii]
MFAQIDEMTDAPVVVEQTSNHRIRIAYGRSVVLSLDGGEARDLVTAVTSVLNELTEHTR